jgi:electron transport complex protein RnfB
MTLTAESIAWACAVAGTLAIVCGLALGWLASRATGSTAAPDVAADRIDALLPQTQCGQCEFAGCRPYAEAIARGEARIDKCVPGGYPTARDLASLLGREPPPIDPARGEHAPPPVVAVIDEERCIGCARCLPACPVDAIVGARRFTHTVIAAQCTGCELCLPPCPVNCIALQPAERGTPPSRWSRAA